MKNKNIFNGMGFAGRLGKLGTIMNDMQERLDFLQTHVDRLEENAYQYRVTFNTGTEMITKLMRSTETVLSVALNPTREGYYFSHWVDLGGDQFDINTPINEDIILTAVWLKLYKVTFDSDGGSAVESQDIPEGYTILPSYLPPEPPTKEGYTFVAWTLNGEVYDFDTPITSDITLKATWALIGG